MSNFVKFKLKDFDKYIYINPDDVFSVTPATNNCNYTHIVFRLDDESYITVEEKCERVVSKLTSKYSSECISKLMQEIFTKTLYIEDSENLMHEVIHIDDLKDIFREVMGWGI